MSYLFYVLIKTTKMASCTSFADESSPILEPLHFEVVADDTLSGLTASPSCPCVLCDAVFNLPSEKEVLLKHLVEKHKIVIAEVSQIADLSKYLCYWKRRFAEAPLSEFCPVVQTNSKPTDLAPSEFYFILCDSLPEDKEVRSKIQIERLEQVLEEQQKERMDNSFSRMCLFCKRHFQGNRSELFDHMTEFHHFNVGHPDNLVFTNELLDLLQEKLCSLKCLYCEKTFKDPTVLKEHMRKKRHKKLHEENAAYHHFYIINYLEIGKNWKDIMSEDDNDTPISAEFSAEMTDDWVESPFAKVVCLFCESLSDDYNNILCHLQSVHGFDLAELFLEFRLNYYQKVKLINFIRRQIRLNNCIYCLEKFLSHELLMNHMTATGHVSRVPASTVWDQPEYFFPTYENDNFLHLLPADERDDDADVSAPKNPNVGNFDGYDRFSAPVVPEEIVFDNLSVEQLLDLNSLNLMEDT